MKTGRKWDWYIFILVRKYGNSFGMILSAKLVYFFIRMHEIASERVKVV